MKVLGIVCSPRLRGNTEILVKETLASARESGAEVELLNITGKNIAPCDGCESCTTTRKCRINDDMQEVYSRLLEADGIVFGTPVYFWGVTAQAKALIDRTFALLHGRRLRNKVAGAVVVARRSGDDVTFSALHNFFHLQRMVCAAGAIGYSSDEEISKTDRGGGAIAYADKRGDVKQDARAMGEARALGTAIVRSIKALQAARKIEP